MALDNQIHLSAATLGAAAGVSRWTVAAVRKAGRNLNDPLPRYSTARDLVAWFRRHPDFVASHQYPRHSASP